jgi:hypothetical protein
LPDFSYNWNFSKTFQCKISWKFVQMFSSCYMQTDGRTDGQTDRHVEANRRIFATFRCERTKKWLLNFGGKPSLKMKDRSKRAPSRYIQRIQIVRKWGYSATFQDHVQWRTLVLALLNLCGLIPESQLFNGYWIYCWHEAWSMASGIVFAIMKYN